MSYISSTPNFAPTSSGSSVIYQGIDVSLVPLNSGIQDLGSLNNPYRNLYAITLNANSSILSGTLRIPTTAPASSTAAGFQGQVATSGSFLYVCSGINLWGRVALQPF